MSYRHWRYHGHWLSTALLLTSIVLSASANTVDEELKRILKASIADKHSFEDRFEAEVWLTQKSSILARFIQAPQQRIDMLKAVHHAATKAQLPPEFVLAVIEVESHFNRYAVSRVGAQGLMQVMPFWKQEIGRSDDNLIDLHTNLQYGCTILKYYLDKADNNWSEALARYNGSYGKLRYPIKVMDAWEKHWR